MLDDLRHLTAVKMNQHTKFAEENGMSSFLMSAKNGDQVKNAFWKIASSLAGSNSVEIILNNNRFHFYFII